MCALADGEIHVLNSLRETPLGSDNEDEDDNDNDSADVRKRGSLAPLMGDAIDLTKPENIVKDLTWQGQAITPGVSASTSVESIVSNVSEEMYQRKWQEGKPHIADVDEVRLRINDLKRAFLKEVVHDHRVTESIGVDLQLWRVRCRSSTFCTVTKHESACPHAYTRSGAIEAALIRPAYHAWRCVIWLDHQLFVHCGLLFWRRFRRHSVLVWVSFACG